MTFTSRRETTRNILSGSQHSDDNSRTSFPALHRLLSKRSTFRFTKAQSVKEKKHRTYKPENIQTINHEPLHVSDLMTFSNGNPTRSKKFRPKIIHTMLIPTINHHIEYTDHQPVPIFNQL